MRKLMPDGRSGLGAYRIAPAAFRKRNGTPEIPSGRSRFLSLKTRPVPGTGDALTASCGAVRKSPFPESCLAVLARMYLILSGPAWAPPFAFLYASFTMAAAVWVRQRLRRSRSLRSVVALEVQRILA